MERLLYIGHAFHRKTQSHKFVLDMLRSDYDVVEKYIDPESEIKSEEFKDLSGETFMVCLCWQIFPDDVLLRAKIRFDKLVFFPMYDGLPQTRRVIDAAWKIRNVLVICFCKAVYDLYRSKGIRCRYIQYFPEPAKNLILGDDKAIYFWQRRENFDLEVLATVCKHLPITRIYHHQALDYKNHCKSVEECGSIAREFLEGCNIYESGWCDNKEAMLREINCAAMYMAPRIKEGIGMSFLEAMAMGRCVVAPNFPTMNEYIEHGKNGLLYQCNAVYSAIEPQPIVETVDIRTLQQNAYEYIKTGHSRWLNERRKIVDWIGEECLSRGRPLMLWFTVFKARIFYKVKDACGSTYYTFGVRLFRHARAN